MLRLLTSKRKSKKRAEGMRALCPADLLNASGRGMNVTSSLKPSEVSKISEGYRELRKT